MRITAGKYRNRQVAVPASGLRPTTEKVRQALFNILGPIDGMRFADLCAGTGAVGIEALSRGAVNVVFVEEDRASVAVIKKNLAALGEEAEVYARSVISFVSSWTGPAFDLVFFDPPYGTKDLYAAVSAAGISRLVRGVLIFEMRSRQDPPECEGMVMRDVRRYGDSTLAFYHPAESLGLPSSDD